MPPSSRDTSSRDATDLAACRALMRGGSRSFFAASYLLPRRVYEPAAALYAFCRLADDAIDEGAAKQPALDALRNRLDRAYAGNPLDHAADRAFAAVVSRTHMPRALPLALLDGFAWDAQGRRYTTLDDLLDYAARVAGSVGAMMAVLMGVRTSHALARACDLGVAMQLTNIARDVGEDARAGRLYLPLDWFSQAGLDPDAFLARPHHNAALANLIERLLHVGDGLYARGATGIDTLPLDCRPGIRAAGLIYADIGRVLAHQGHNAIDRRAHVPARRKAALLGRSLLAALPAADPMPLPALASCEYLVEAALLDGRKSRMPKSIRALEARVTWVLDLFARLHQQQWETS